jgi:2,4-dienoyl-CoA reductase-like NADH-dependent reductase (Old Yellow Enzyme family)
MTLPVCKTGWPELNLQIMSKSSILFSPLTAGEIEFSNRVVMAPLTRCRAVDRRIPNDLMVEYYRQRASAGLILSEATAVDPMGVGYPNTPGIWNDAQMEAWKSVTTAVHEAGGRILLQLWHVGRISDPHYLNGELPVAPSAIAADGHVSLLRPKRPFLTPRALELTEIPEVVEAYRKGAERAKEAGFDGVEIHGANGYLIDQFLQASSNHRTDSYGGSIENRARFLLEVTDAVISVWGPGRTGMHLAPRGGEDPENDPTGEKLFTHVATELGRRKIAFICGREQQGEGWLGPRLKAAFGGVYIANQAFTRDTAATLVESGKADAVAFGRLFIANPDLPRRFAESAPLNEPVADTFYADGAEGYVDYPSLDE